MIPGERPRPWSRPPRGWGWAVAAGGVLVVTALAIGPRLADWWWPESDAAALRARAERALQDGRLSMADGSGARELYEAALALQPDQVEAREGLARVARAALADARALPYQLSARTSYSFGPDGVHCTISIPVSASTTEPDRHD